MGIGKSTILIILLLLSQQVYAARGFYSTLGTNSSDVVVSNYTGGISVNISLSLWIWINGSGGGTFGRAFDQYNSSAVGSGFCLYNNNGANMTVQIPWTGTMGQFNIVMPSSNAWHHVLITYNASSTGNKPTIYVDGLSWTVTVVTVPSGAVKTLSGSYYIGNRQDGIRGWDGKVADFAIWNGAILNAGEAMALARGVVPLRVRNGPQLYLPLTGIQTGEANWGSVASSQAVTGTKFRTDPNIQRYPFIWQGN